MKTETKFKQTEIGMIPEKMTASYLLSVKENVETIILNKNISEKSLNPSNFKGIILESVKDWRVRVLNGEIKEKEDFPSTAYHRRGKLFFHEELLRDVRVFFSNAGSSYLENVDYFKKYLVGLMMHEILHILLGHYKGDSSEELEVEEIMKDSFLQNQRDFERGEYESISVSNKEYSL